MSRFALRRLARWWSLLALPCAAGLAQTSPVVVQAESGTLGAEWAVATVGGAGALTAAVTGAGQSPGSAARVASFVVTFPAAGTYALHARVFVGPDGFNDDSFFYAGGFGAKDPAAAGDWILANGLAGVGRTVATEVVDGAGPDANGVWKWIRLSAFDGGELPVSFVVPAGALTQIFQIGAREDGLAIDRFVFGLAELNFTVANLEAGEPGTEPAPPPPLPPFVLPTQPLATGKPKFLGSAFGRGNGRATNFELFWNQVTPENAGKWGSVENVRDVMNWAELDDAHDFAKSHGFPFKLHTVIWGNQQPGWISALPPEEQLAEIDEWIAALAARYPDAEFIDVVNEPIRNPPDGKVPSFGGSVHANYVAALGGAGATGWDWVLNSFRKVRAAFPNAKLLLNEFSVTNDAGAAATYVQIVNLLKAEPGNLLDGVGIQAHAFSTTVPNAVTLANLNLIAGTGMPLYITELDINAPPQTPADAARSEQIQLDEYRRIFPLFWEHPAGRAVTLWGYKPGNFQPNAFLMRADDTPRPALVWLQAFVENDRPVVDAAQEFALPPARRTARSSAGCAPATATPRTRSAAGASPAARRPASSRSIRRPATSPWPTRPG